ncbi:glucose 1-dehydrogenase [Gordonia sp. LSe1-13]|uniref:Glucose 1-dehydrogenase n=1 Tax=Gordonia sesuvii TaxID=3116777 RepID=A0ABU7M9E7_9ACTN|nr:glucose 1-dehydrogenase [Gordonia sp. LSe1-13]
MKRLEGKTALVSGGASGIGAAAVRACAAEGAQVVIADIVDEPGRALAAEFDDQVVFTHLDVTDATQWMDAVSAAKHTFGQLNVLVNAAGIMSPPAPIEDFDRGAWDRMLNVNLTGSMVGISAAVATLKQSSPASIVNISSYAGIRGVAGRHAYTASKWGVTGLTKSCALELADSGVRVNSVHPGGVRTPMLAEELKSAPPEMLEATSTLVRLAEPEEIASLIVFLASDESSFSTGAEFLVDGGVSAG